MATDGFPGQMQRDTRQDRAAYLQPPRPLQPHASSCTHKPDDQNDRSTPRRIRLQKLAGAAVHTGQPIQQPNSSSANIEYETNADSLKGGTSC